MSQYQFKLDQENSTKPFEETHYYVENGILHSDEKNDIKLSKNNEIIAENSEISKEDFQDLVPLMDIPSSSDGILNLDEFDGILNLDEFDEKLKFDEASTKPFEETHYFDENGILQVEEKFDIKLSKNTDNTEITKEDFQDLVPLMDLPRPCDPILNLDEFDNENEILNENEKTPIDTTPSLKPVLCECHRERMLAHSA